ncbi:hypothetical protein LCGC14_1233540 [marine sediment metagenome]|uniref:Uncharacterized protein n=1 Tax=marine sediment metagenome TaxID=412755 RepID=A0A0F9L7V1_9ZZZZ
MPDRIKMTDNQGMFKKGQKVFKVHHYSGVNIVYEEIDVNQYDERVVKLAKKIAGMPEVNLLDVLTDALYDISLKRLEKVEKSFAEELEKADPQVRTTKRDRGTCINLAIGKRFAFEVRQ